MHTLDQTLPLSSDNEHAQKPVTVASRRQAFRTLHASGCFVIPNPWDVGSARYLEHLGFAALATTSAGFAFSQGLPDTEAAVSLERSLGHIADIVGAVRLPVNADFAAGYGESPAAVAESVRRCVQTGVAGLSIEDATGDPRRPLYDIDDAVARLRAAREAIDRSGHDVVLTARAECYHVGHPDPLPDTLRRLRAYASVGADVLFAPGVAGSEEIEILVNAMQPKPVNLLVVHDMGLRVADYAALGVRRISVGGSLALAAWGGFVRAAEALQTSGSFPGATDLVPYPVLNELFEARAQSSVTHGG